MSPTRNQRTSCQNFKASLKQMQDLLSSYHPQEMTLIDHRDLIDVLAIHKLQDLDNILVWAHPSELQQWNHDFFHPNLIPLVSRDFIDFVKSDNALEEIAVHDQKAMAAGPEKKVFDKCGQSRSALNARAVSRHHVVGFDS
jgi:hypothetical protein